MRLTPEEYRHVSDAWKECRDALQKDSWERMRVGAAIGIQPWVKKKVTARELVPLPWDEGAGHAPAVTLNKAEALARFKRLAARHGNDNDNDNENDEKL